MKKTIIVGTVVALGSYVFSTVISNTNYLGKTSTELAMATSALAGVLAGLATLLMR